MKISYNWLKWYIPEAPSAEELHDVLTYHLTEVEGVEKVGEDTIFDLNILPNRAHDLLSHQGVARELSGQLGIAFKDPTEMYTIPEVNRKVLPSDVLKVEIQSEKCRRYMARIIRNVKVGPSPEWVVKHLESIGQRSINNIVDATNIVMYDCGQPCHAFDLKSISPSPLKGEGRGEVHEIVIKTAENNTEIKVVGREGITAKLNENDLVITTPSHNVGEGRGEVLAIAGVKGGLDSGINEDTTDIVLEVANFNPESVRKTARRLGLLSDSAKRFENDLSPEQASYAMRELSALFLDPGMNCIGAVFEEIVDVYPYPQIKKEISFTTLFINQKLGTQITDSEIELILNNYNFTYTKNNEGYTLQVPPLRLDLVTKTDIAEEIGRIYGYDKFVPNIPKINFVPKENDVYKKIIFARNKLVSEGYREVMTYSFANKGEVEVLASASDKNFLRTNLSDGIKKSFELNKLNAPLLGTDEIKIFEIGTVFGKNGEQINVCYANKKEIKEMSLDHYFASYASSEDKNSGPRISSHSAYSSVSRPDQEFLSSDFATATFKPWSLFPFITRDIAVWVPENVEAEELKNIYQEFGTELLINEPKCVDTFSKDGKTSYAFRLVFQSYEKTLTDEEINQIMSKITEKISRNSWIVR